MHVVALREVIRVCDERRAAGDCATPNPFSKEQLEDAVLDLVAVINRPGLRLLVTDEWLRRKIQADPDGEPSAGGGTPPLPEEETPHE